MRTPSILAAALAGAVTMGFPESHTLHAEESGERSAQEITTPLLATPLAGMESREVRVFHISAPPGFVTPKHYHPGQLIIYVVEGAITVDIEGQAPVKLKAGDILEEPSGKAMVGRNPSLTQKAAMIVFQIGKKGEPLTVETD